MVMVKYLPEPGTPDKTETLHHTFSKRTPTEVTDPVVIAVLRGSPFFDVLDDDKGSKVAAPGISNGVSPFVASEQSDGGFAIMSGPEVVKDGLTKEDADAFNALSDEDKAEYVAA
jgi:hypothetical protein